MLRNDPKSPTSEDEIDQGFVVIEDTQTILKTTYEKIQQLQSEKEEVERKLADSQSKINEHEGILQKVLNDLGVISSKLTQALEGIKQEHLQLEESQKAHLAAQQQVEKLEIENAILNDLLRMSWQSVLRTDHMNQLLTHSFEQNGMQLIQMGETLQKLSELGRELEQTSLSETNPKEKESKKTTTLNAPTDLSSQVSQIYEETYRDLQTAPTTSSRDKQATSHLNQRVKHKYQKEPKPKHLSHGGRMFYDRHPTRPLHQPTSRGHQHHLKKS